jgi:hypothetical protein
MRLCSLNTSTKLFRIEKWKAGVSNFRRDRHKSPWKRNRVLINSSEELEIGRYRS